MRDSDERLIELETQLAESQRSLELLDGEVVRQGNRIEGLEEELATLRRGLAAIVRKLPPAE